MKKFFLTTTIIVLLGLGVLLVRRNFFTEPVLEFAATDASANWLTYSNDKIGFHIKYPPDGWSINQFGTIATFSNETAGFSIGIRWYPDSADVVIAHFQKELPHLMKIGDATISGIKVKQLHSIGGNFDGRWRTDDLFFPGASGTYEISVSNTSTRREEKLKESALMDPLAREMIGTFGASEIKPSDYLTHNNSRYHFSFTYPADWNVNFGATGVSLRSDKPTSEYWLTLNVMPHTTITGYLERFGGFAPNLEGKREYFANRIFGQKYSQHDAEGYYFEKDGNLYDIHIFRIKGPRKPVDEILDSLEL